MPDNASSPECLRAREPGAAAGLRRRPQGDRSVPVPPSRAGVHHPTDEHVLQSASRAPCAHFRLLP
eukprot:7066853-Pyramimonas_sp.AAC.1